LHNSFPHKSDIEIKSVERKYYRYLSDLIIETIKMISAPPSFFLKRFSFSNTELLTNFESKQESYLIAASHYANWEWNVIVCPLIFKAKTLIIYKELRNKDFNTFFKKTREKSGSKMITMKLALRSIIKHKNELTLTVFAADQSPAHKESQIHINFLNQKTKVFYGLEKTAKFTNYPVIFADLQRIKRGYYHCDFKLITDNPSKNKDEEITKKYFQLLEERIDTEPQYWLWSHKRWKYIL
jgi:KDO2-lipid IV(A) lauroyltransferase